METIHQNYEINESTMAILSAAHIDYASNIFEKHGTIHVKQTPIQLIKTACLDGGSTYDGRRKAVAHLTGALQKVPIPINPRSQLFAFPTQSPTAFDCSWIFYHHVRSIQPQKHNPSQSIILFKNGYELTLPESPYILQKQMQRTAICILQFSTNKAEVY